MNRTKDGESNLHDKIRMILIKNKRFMKAWEIVNAIFEATGFRYSESGMTARLREMKDVVCNLSKYTYGFSFWEQSA